LPQSTRRQLRDAIEFHLLTQRVAVNRSDAKAFKAYPITYL
jgi:hypothetical protein